MQPKQRNGKYAEWSQRLTYKAVLDCCFVILAVFVLFLLNCSGESQSLKSTGTEQKSVRKEETADQPLADYRFQLLDLAFDTASAIPLQPHHKDRSRAQEAVVTASLKLDQPMRSIGYIEQIEDWRRGSCYADLGFYYAQHGDVEAMRHCLQKAEEIAEEAEDWRKDRIRAKLAQAHAWLGEYEKAEEFEADVVDSEAGKAASIRAMVGEEESFDEQIKNLDAGIALDNFDITKNALETYTQLYNRFYGDENRRSLIEEKIRSAWHSIPIFIRIELLMQLSEFSLEHTDKNKALALVNETQMLLEEYQWKPEHRISLAARLASLRFRAGNKQKAKSDADEMLAHFQARKESIVNIWRAGALRPLAQAYQEMGDVKAALAVYKIAVEEGVENPNSRPRAEDLSATCREMALHGIEPDNELWNRLHDIREGLGDPW